MEFTKKRRWLRWTAVAVTVVLGFITFLLSPRIIGMAQKSSPPASESKGPAPNAEKKHPNRLISEKSPYLLQHAHNPVDWYPWGEEAFAKARKEDKPIFLSIGYSTCHWCHVMERESFEDPDVAKWLNDVFIAIKVDREERPDIDNIYMTVCQMLTGSGGWPLTILMTPDKKPFYAGTYFPKESRFGRIGLLEMAPRVQELWKTKRDDLLNSANKITSALQTSSPDTAGENLGEPVLQSAYEQLARTFDGQNGGFGKAPKFPTAHQLLFLLRYWKRRGDAQALAMVEKTLQAIRRGGVYDHVGFGVHRYSTDGEWRVPHFEKMLYDQAMLALAYTEAYQAAGNKEYERTAREIFTYVLRDMTAPAGAFYSAEDADSEGEEGKFYLWTAKEFRQVLGPAEAELMARALSVETDGNFTEPSAQSKTGANILYRKKPLAEIAADLKQSEPALQTTLENARQKLFAARARRVPPHKDDKILTDWNGLMITALAKGAQVFDEPKYAEAAQRAADFILRHLRKPDGRLWHRYRDGQAALPAQIDDYAFLIGGLIDLYEASFDVRYLQAALDLSKDWLAHYWDDKNGGFYFTSDDGERLLARPKESYDGALPSGNSVAMLDLLRLGRLTANSDLEKKAAHIGRAFSKDIRRSPSGHTQLLLGLDFGLGPSYEVVIAGRASAADTKALLSALRRRFIPNKVVLFRPDDQTSPDIVRLAPFTRSQLGRRGRATAYVCLNYNCKLPTTDAGKMLELLK